MLKIPAFPFFLYILALLLFMGYPSAGQPPLISTRRQLDSLYRQRPQIRLVPLETTVPNLKKDIRYATRNNFTHQVLYQKPTLYLAAPAAERLKKAADSLAVLGLGLMVFDAYRPYGVTVKMWQIVPDERYAANPAKGSGHNRGIAVDLTLYDLRSGRPLDMPTDYDQFSDTAHHSVLNLPPPVLQNRKTLKSAMEHVGFKALDTEWWHYSLPDAAGYPLLNIDFKNLRKWLPAPINP